MSFSVNTVSAGATAVMSSPYVSAQQMQVSRVDTAAQTDSGSVRSTDTAAGSFGVSGDKIEISAAGRKALEQIYASRAAQKTSATASASAPEKTEAASTAVQSASARAMEEVAAADKTVKPAVSARTAPVQTEKAQTNDKLDLPGASTQDEAAQELAQAEQSIQPLTASEDKVTSADLESMSVSDMRTLVNDGTITRADMDRELSRREKASEQSEKQSEAVAQAASKASDSMKDVSNMTGKMSTYNATKQYAAMAQAFA